MWEVAASLQAIREPAGAGVHLPWLRGLGDRLRELDLSTALALLPLRGFTPDFLAPPPTGPLTDFATEIERMRATPPQVVRSDIETFRRAHPRTKVAERFLRRPAHEVGRLADVLEAYWTAALEPHWPRIRAFMEADVAHRARRITEGGPARLFADLHHTTAWRGDHVAIEHRWTEDVALAGRGLVLMPSAFSWERVSTMTTPPWQPAIIYPARGVATLWEAGEAAPGGLADVLGRTRADLLAALDAPRSTTDLARLLGLTAGGVSQHLGRLKAAGLVTAQRDGRLVLYARTQAAETLLRR